VNDQPVIVKIIQARGGKTYPAGLPLPEAEKRRARVIAHRLVCRDKLTYLAAVDAMLAYGIKRSAGWLTKTINGFDCGPQCAGRPAEPEPSEPQEQPQARVHQAPGGLTGMVSGG
jgi:hypothetical protein